jgi:hypothetical protein
MNRLAKLQLIGPVFLFVAVLAAEAGAYALAMFPSFEPLWYVNLKLFGMFQRSYYVVDSYTGVPSFNLFFIALPILLLGCVGVFGRKRLLLAISSNLSFVYAGLLIHQWMLMQPRALQASLTAIALPVADADLYLVATLLGASLLSFCVSHFTYVRDVRIAR